MLYQVYLEEAGRRGGVLEPGEDRDGAADGLGTRSAADFHPLFRLSQEAVDGTGLIFFEFAGGRIGYAVVFFQPEEGGEEFSTGPVEVFPQQFEHIGEGGVIIGSVDSFFRLLLPGRARYSSRIRDFSLFPAFR
jgi:hypothetical protein